MHLLLTKRIGLGDRSFVTKSKKFQFIVPLPPPVVFYRNNHGVVQYILPKTRPREVTLGEPEPIQSGEMVKVFPEKAAVKVPRGTGAESPKTKDGRLLYPDTASESVSLFHQMGFLKQTLLATNGGGLKGALPMIMLAGAIAFFAAYTVFTVIHPGFTAVPPPGYCYRIVPINNMTKVTVQGCLAP